MRYFCSLLLKRSALEFNCVQIVTCGYIPLTKGEGNGATTQGVNRENNFVILLEIY